MDVLCRNHQHIWFIHKRTTKRRRNCRRWRDWPSSQTPAGVIDSNPNRNLMVFLIKSNTPAKFKVDQLSDCLQDRRTDEQTDRLRWFPSVWFLGVHFGCPSFSQWRLPKLHKSRLPGFTVSRYNEYSLFFFDSRHRHCVTRHFSHRLLLISETLHWAFLVSQLGSDTPQGRYFFHHCLSVCPLCKLLCLYVSRIIEKQLDSFNETCWRTWCWFKSVWIRIWRRIQELF